MARHAKCRTTQARLDCAPTGLAVGNVEGNGEPDGVMINDCNDAVRIVYR